MSLWPRPAIGTNHGARAEPVRQRLAHGERHDPSSVPCRISTGILIPGTQRRRVEAVGHEGSYRIDRKALRCDIGNAV
jgi:hypothetical protein